MHKGKKKRLIKLLLVELRTLDLNTKKICNTLGIVVFVSPDKDRHSGSVVEHPLCDLEVVGLIPGRVIPKTLKMVLAALSLGAQH